MNSASQHRQGNKFWYFNPSARQGGGEFRYNWDLILPEAARIVKTYKSAVTLRQLFYRLVAAEMLPNTQASYSSLSSKSAEARRAGTFPGLMDRGREIDRPHLWTDAADAATWLAEQYMESRAANQDVNIYVAVEKNALRGQLFEWFVPMGLPIIALGGYPSQTLVDEVYDDAVGDPRNAVLIYGGDFDADGEDIGRDFVSRTGIFDEIIRVALNPDQIKQYELPPQPGKWSSARAKGFAEKYGDLFQDVYGYDLVQIELDAIPPEELRKIYKKAIDEFFDYDKYEEIIFHENKERKKIENLATEESDRADEEDDEE